nr:phage minor tail protein L [uncultured Mediterranean phage uvMED]
MTRVLSTAVKNELLTREIRPVHLLNIDFSTPVNITDCSFNLTSSISGSSVTYTASPFLVGASSFEEQTDISKSSLSISLSGADQTFISTVLNENIVNVSVSIFRGLLNSSNALISDPILLYQGNVDTFEITETETRSNLKLIVVSHWADFEKKAGRKTNNASQQRFFSTDVGMDFASQTVLDIKWGAE